MAIRVGLEDARTVFARYKRIREAERQYVAPGEGEKCGDACASPGSQSSGLIRMFL